MTDFDIDRDEEMSADADAREADRLYPYRSPHKGPTLHEQLDGILESAKPGAMCLDHEAESVTAWPRYLNAYTQERRYGGPEGGGWWYDALDPVCEGMSLSDMMTSPTSFQSQRPQPVSVEVGNHDHILMAWNAFEKRIDDAVDLEADRVLVYLEGAPAWYTPRPHYE